jgi:hypothetical protein
MSEVVFCAVQKVLTKCNTGLKFANEAFAKGSTRLLSEKP